MIADPACVLVHVWDNVHLHLSCWFDFLLLFGRFAGGFKRLLGRSEDVVANIVREDTNHQLLRVPTTEHQQDNSKLRFEFIALGALAELCVLNTSRRSRVYLRHCSLSWTARMLLRKLATQLSSRPLVFLVVSESGTVRSYDDTGLC
jgi:hypothetical protein